MIECDPEVAAVPAQGRPRRRSRSARTRYRAVWISDVHLGTRGCKAESLSSFLDSCDSQWLYLVGDIVDGWQIKKRCSWSPAQTELVQRVLAKARSRTRVVYIPGNHDEGLRAYGALSLAGIRVVAEAVHLTQDGKRLWVLHGDRFDAVVRNHRWLAHLGDHAYALALALNCWFNAARRLCGLRYWSLSAYLKQRVKDAVSFVSEFEKAVAHEARRRAFDGVVCGHIHKAELRTIDGLIYANDGDWVESCTALVEHLDGRLEIVHWPADATPERAQERAVLRVDELFALEA